MEGPKKPVSFTLAPQHHFELNALAYVLGTTVSELARVFIEVGLVNNPLNPEDIAAYRRHLERAELRRDIRDAIGGFRVPNLLRQLRGFPAWATDHDDIQRLHRIDSALSRGSVVTLLMRDGSQVTGLVVAKSLVDLPPTMPGERLKSRGSVSLKRSDTPHGEDHDVDLIDVEGVARATFVCE